MGAEDLISKWVAAIPVVPYTEYVAVSVVDALLQIAANDYLRPFIPANVWLWLNKRPSLPPACQGLESGRRRSVVQMVRGLNNIGILTSYLIVVWSEHGGHLDSEGFVEMEVSAREDFNGIGMGCHRVELIQRLDHILSKLDQEPEIETRDKYRKLKRILQDVDQEAAEILNCMSHSFIFLSLLTLTDLHRIPLHFHVCLAFPMSITSHLDHSTSFPPIPNLYHVFCALLIDSEHSLFCLDTCHLGPLDTPVRKFVAVFFHHVPGPLPSCPRFVSPL